MKILNILLVICAMWVVGIFYFSYQKSMYERISTEADLEFISNYYNSLGNGGGSWGSSEHTDIVVSVPPDDIKEQLKTSNDLLFMAIDEFWSISVCGSTSTRVITLDYTDKMVLAACNDNNGEMYEGSDTPFMQIKL